ncbi:hypothetical protein D3C78_1009670 [compost metagenome]
MPIKVGDILQRASITLNDEDFVRWTKDELYGWVNDGACEVVLRRPAARAVTTVVTLIAGTFQQMPEGTLVLLDVIRNVKADDSPGRPVRRIDRQLLDDQLPTWQEMKQADTIKHFMFEEAAPTTFYVYPPAKAGIKADILHSEAPPLITGDDDMLQLDRAYIGPIVSYVMYRCLAKDSEYANAAMATGHFQAFTEALGVQNEVTNAASPNVRSV